MATSVALDLDGLRSFVAVADRLAFNAAALQLNISTSALTRRVQRLELSLGFPVFERSTRSVHLTRAGELFLPHARQVLAEVAAGLAAVRADVQERSGTLTFAALPTVTAHLLPRIIRAFRDHRPDVHVRVVECSAADVVRHLHEGSTAFGFTFRNTLDPTLAFDPVLVDPFCLIMPPNHPLTEQEEVAWRSLKPHALITAGGQSGNMALLNEALQEVDWRSDTTYEIEHLTTSVGLVQAGLGISVVPRSSLPLGPHPDIVVRPLVEPRVTRTLGLFWRRHEPLSAAAKHFLRVAQRVATEMRDEPVKPA